MSDEGYRVPIEGPDPPGDGEQAQPEGAASPEKEAQAPEESSGSAQAEVSETVTEERLEAELAELTREIETLRDNYLRARADLENYRRRAAREREETVRSAIASLLREVLPVLDNLDRAIAAAAGTQDHASLIEGVELTRRQFQAFLDARGVTEIKAQGEKFDPLWHEAVGKKPTADHPEGIVVEEVQKGYRLDDLILRPSKVIVAVAPQAERGDDQPAPS